MKTFRVDASVYYRSHFKNIYDSPCKTEKDNFLKFPPKDEDRMTAAFNLLFGYLPNALASYMQFAANVDPDIFSNMSTLSDVNLFSKVKFEKIQETKLNCISRLSSSDSEEIVSDLLKASQSVGTLTENLINRKTTNLLCVIENLMQINIFPSIIGPADDVSKRKTLAYMMVKLGSTKHLIHKVTGVGSKIIKDLCDATTTDYTRPIRKYKLCNNENFGVNHLLRVCNNKQASNQIMLMISLYTICCRILLNKLPTANHFDQEDIGDRLSIPLAIGVYKTSYDMCRNFSRLYPDKTINSFDFVFFDDFYNALEIYTSKQAEVVACEDCHTPYLNLYAKKGTRKTILAANDDEIFSARKLTICPNCKCRFDYSLYE